MTPKCMPGDLAVVVQAFNEVNVGSIVKVLTLYADQFELAVPGNDVLWTCRASHCLTYDYGGIKKVRITGPVPDSSLQPIRGEPIGHDIAMFVEIQMLREQGADVAVIERVRSYF